MAKDTQNPRDRSHAERAEKDGDRTDADRADERTVLEQNPDLDPNEPGIDDVERNRRHEELTRRQG